MVPPAPIAPAAADRSYITENAAELRRLHIAALGWWRDRCSEEAIGRFLAERLNAL